MIPGAKPATAEEPGLISRERKPIVPASDTASPDRKVQQPADAPAPASKAESKKKDKKTKSIKEKTGTEGWDDD